MESGKRSTSLLVISLLTAALLALFPPLTLWACAVLYIFIYLAVGVRLELVDGVISTMRAWGWPGVIIILVILPALSAGLSGGALWLTTSRSLKGQRAARWTFYTAVVLLILISLLFMTRRRMLAG